ncbi:exosome complex exonuclease Rrp41 [Candidatus Woesearchaeota archaeon CG08_land_8_20_14_0_20_47_9]|nr:MAG: exosome complex exonuclease Rrp41 [Candidatus Woesearchaeota archaeon CG1_02_47_18]PIN73043.1 MAG: exosome complex exonuclease Rrp41 [Candidatus Woesearchaeota archaeon CG10_big_fil_rev_8_21_14_0_10_47_5]PIO03686.1 MAG: exosome complex exonuclease Rrp41 [Candidatus Woesearchaeota archaeon CG08_land_8_20_14_0_20_47_9]HII30104.1 exosome complex exonuclease Rrp41 [Candidatus Woesearchaeota archaeon]
MGYDKRFDGRRADQMREIEARVGVIPRADGSAYFRIGRTIAYAAVYGPRNLYPRFLQDPSKGILRCRYNMMPFSGSGERVRPGGNRRSKEISMVTENALMPVLNLDDFPNAVVDVFIELPQTDSGTRCAGICAASMALADAGISMRDLVTSVSVGKVGSSLLVDLTYDEEAYEDEPVSDVPVAILPRTGQISLLQMDGEIEKDELIRLLDMAKKACWGIYEVQKAALKERFNCVKAD